MMPTFPSTPLKFRTASFPGTDSRPEYQTRPSPKNWSAIVLRANCFHPVLLLCVRDDARVRHVRADPTALPRGPSLRSGLCCPGPSLLSLAPLAGTSRLRRWRLIRDAIAVPIRIGPDNPDWLPRSRQPFSTCSLIDAQLSGFALRHWSTASRDMPKISVPSNIAFALWARPND
jgi:hypothetical protein